MIALHNNNTPAAVESATGVPTTDCSIDAAADGPDRGALPTVTELAAHLNADGVSKLATRTVRYVSLTSGLIVTRLLAGDAPMREVVQEPRRPERTLILAHDPWMGDEQARDVAIACVRELLAHKLRYVPAFLVQVLLNELPQSSALGDRSDVAASQPDRGIGAPVPAAVLAPFLVEACFAEFVRSPADEGGH